MDKCLNFCEIKGIESILCILGLNFPDSATDFQKAFLTLAHLSASCRDFVLKGIEVPQHLVGLVAILAAIINENDDKQL